MQGPLICDTDNGCNQPERFRAERRNAGGQRSVLLVMKELLKQPLARGEVACVQNQSQSISMLVVVREVDLVKSGA